MLTRSSTKTSQKPAKRLQKIPVECNYIVFMTCYTSRIKKEVLEEATKEREIDAVPLFSVDHVWGNGFRVLSNEPESKTLHKLLRKEKIQECVAFRSEYENVFCLYDILKDEVNFCRMFGITSMNYYSSPLGKIMFVGIDSESG